MTDGSQKPFCSFARAKKKRRKGKGDRERSQKNEQAVAHAVARTSKQQAPSKPTNNQHELHGYVHPQGRRRQANPVQEGRLQGHPQTSHDGRHAGKKTRRPSRRLERARDPGRAPAGLSRASVVARDALPPPAAADATSRARSRRAAPQSRRREPSNHRRSQASTRNNDADAAHSLSLSLCHHRDSPGPQAREEVRVLVLLAPSLRRRYLQAG